MSTQDPHKKPPTANNQRTVDPYSAGDPIPVPEVTESDTDTAWDMFEDLAEPKTKPTSSPDHFAETIPADLEPMSKKPPATPLWKSRG